MVPSSVLAIAADNERLSCGGFSLSKTIHFGILEFIANCFGGLSLSSMGDGLDAIIIGPARGRPPSPRPPLSKEAWHGGFACPRHNHIMAGEHFDRTSYNGYSMPRPDIDLPLRQRCAH
jgi:hypothetical protein